MLKQSKTGSSTYIVHRPSTGIQARLEQLAVILKTYEMVRSKRICTCKPWFICHMWLLMYHHKSGPSEFGPNSLVLYIGKFGLGTAFPGEYGSCQENFEFSCDKVGCWRWQELSTFFEWWRRDREGKRGDQRYRFIGFVPTNGKTTTM